MAIELDAEQGVYALTGSVAGLVHALKMALQAGTYTFNGASATLVVDDGAPTDTPLKRTVFVVAEDRVVTVLLEDRVVTSPRLPI